MGSGRPTTTMAPAKHYLYHPKILRKRLSPEQASMLNNPSFSCLCDRVYGSAFLSYTKLHSIFRMPVVYADSAKSEGDVTLNVSEDSDTVNDSRSKAVSTAMMPSLQIVHAPIREAILDSMTTEMEVQNVLDNETGMDRLKEMFSKQDMGDGSAYSQELGIVGQVMSNTMLLSFITMTIRESFDAKKRFIEQNRATVFASKAFAQRRINDYVLVEGAKVGLKWSVKLTSFTTIFMLVSQCVSMYKNKTSILDYGLAGGVTGALFKMNLGLKGMFIGSAVGLLFGFSGGLIICPLMRLTNETQEQRHYRHIKNRLDSNRERTVTDKETVMDTEVSGQIPAEPIGQ